MELQPIEEGPFNAETPLAALDRAVVANDVFYVRNHFEVPQGDESTWRLSVTGAVSRELDVALADLKELPYEEAETTLECAGNGRTLMDPTPEGTPWGLGGVATARFGGTRVSTVLAQAGVGSGAIEVVATGADSGEADGAVVEHYAFGIPLEVALDDRSLLAWTMNGEQLPPNHGFPLRLVVGGLYGMASVKWLTSLQVVREPFDGHFATHYRYEADSEGRSGKVGRIEVRALIAHPQHGDGVSGEIEVRGSAWSGHAPIDRVEVSGDGGATWTDADLQPAASRYAATLWSFSWSPPGPGAHEVVARATDRNGNTQPSASAWNALGYGNNACHRITVEVGAEKR